MNANLINRKPVVAGQFYPSNSNELKNSLALMFSKSVKGIQVENTIALIAPHAGYVYSGIVAASAINQMSPTKHYKTIFIIASSHNAHYNSASVYTLGNFETPIGEIQVDLETARKLVSENDCFAYVSEGHANEHSIEVLLPFIQFSRKNDFKIVPIVIGTHDEKVCEKIAEGLKPYFNSDNFFIVSTDFSHYPSYKAANNVDEMTIQSICLNKPEEFLKTLSNIEKLNILNLQTSCCGWTSVLTLLYLTYQKKDIEYSKIQYLNSGDAKISSMDKVVGYSAISIKIKQNQKEEFKLSEKDKNDLLFIARNSISEMIKSGKVLKINESELSDNLKLNGGAFVSLHKQNELRGCIGRFDARSALYSVVQNMAISAAFKDTRFSPVTEKELDLIEIEISVLTPMKKIDSIEEIELGKHGIYITKGQNSGTFLPQVATETGWNLEEFLGYCAKDKAGIGWTGWKDSSIYIYEALVFGEKSK